MKRLLTAVIALIVITLSSCGLSAELTISDVDPVESAIRSSVITDFEDGSVITIVAETLDDLALAVSRYTETGYTIVSYPAALSDVIGRYTYTNIYWYCSLRRTRSCRDSGKSSISRRIDGKTISQFSPP